ncbi:MAG TPA: hypothetical protein VH476_01260, partial [Solirubrobacterales bacterium]
VDAAKEAIATFNLEQHLLKVSLNGTGTGTVTSAPSGISCTSGTCQSNFDHGTLVKLSGAPGPNSKAVAWTTCPGTVNGSNQCEVTLNEAKEAIATFNLSRARLTVIKAGTGSGTVTSSPSGIDCGAESGCAAEFEEGEIVTLTGVSEGGSGPVSWSGCDSIVGANQCELTINEDKTVTATFGPEQHLLKVTRNGAGPGAVTSTPSGINCGGGGACQASFDHGATVTLSGVPGANSQPVVWESCPGTVNGADECEVKVDEAKEARALFNLVQRKLTVTTDGNGSGNVTSTPVGIACTANTTCEAGFSHGTLVRLTGTPDAGTSPVVWESCPGTVNGSNECEVTMDAAKAATATFSLGEQHLLVTKVGSGTGTVTSSPGGIECGEDCDAEYEGGADVTLAGSSGPNTKPVVWLGCGTIVGENECRVTMSSAKEVRASFGLEQHLLKVTKSGAGLGHVSSAPAGIGCGGTCQASFDHEAVVRLTGTSGTGTEPVVWSACPGTVDGTNHCIVTMNTTHEVIATFNRVSTEGEAQVSEAVEVGETTPKPKSKKSAKARALAKCKKLKRKKARGRCVRRVKSQFKRRRQKREFRGSWLGNRHRWGWR